MQEQYSNMQLLGRDRYRNIFLHNSTVTIGPNEIRLNTRKIKVLRLREQLR